MLDAAQLGANLRAARDRRGLSQDDVAQALGIPRTAVTNIESGTRSVSTLELSRLAALYGKPVATFLGEKETATEDLSVVLPRALPAVEVTREMRADIDRFVDLCREGVTLRELLSITVGQTLPNYGIRPTSVGEAIRQAEVVAQEERRRLGLGIGPIGEIAELINSQGIWTDTTRLPNEVSGLFIRHHEIGLAILVNAGHARVRRRFSYAHEFAHALFDREHAITLTQQDNSTQLVEKRANAFAAAFLMPADGVADQLRRLDKGHPSRLALLLFDVANDRSIEAEIRPPSGSQAITYQDVAVLARHFSVSYDAAVWRLKSLNYLNSNETSALIDHRQTGNRYIEKLGFMDLLEGEQIGEAQHQELSNQLAHLAIEAFRRGEISAGRVRDIGARLEFGADDLIEFAEAARGE